VGRRTWSGVGGEQQVDVVDLLDDSVGEGPQQMGALLGEEGGGRLLVEDQEEGVAADVVYLDVDWYDVDSA
jgi:hypothetical protein